MNRTEHWNHIYQTNPPDDVSWFQAQPKISLRLTKACGVAKGDGIIDVGGGASVLVDFLLEAGYRGLAVLDISAAALDHAKRRLGARASAVQPMSRRSFRRVSSDSGTTALCSTF